MSHVQGGEAMLRLIILLCISVILFVFPSGAEETFKTDLGGWSSTGKWNITQKGYTSVNNSGNSFLVSDGYIKQGKEFTYAADVIDSKGGGSGIAIVYKGGWYCFQVDTVNHSYSAFHIKDNKAVWNVSGQMTESERNKDTYKLRITYKNGTFEFYENDVKKLEKKDNDFQGGKPALKTYENEASFNNVYCSQAVKITYSVSGTFSSDMVIQRERETRVWGKGAAGDEITVSFHRKDYSCTVDKNGTWEVKLPALKYSNQPSEMVIKSKASDYVTVFDNILIGDVWIVSGQSNSDLPMNFTIWANQEFKKEIKETDPIRIFGQYRSDAIRSDKLRTAQDDVISSLYCWQTTTWETVSSFSALGYHFAKELIRHTDVPIGVIMAGSSGSPISHFLPEDIAKTLGYPKNENAEICTSGIYNVFLSPFLKTAFKGFIFYQGESDNERYMKYTDELYALVKELRKEFNYDFPLYNVQLSSHGARILTEWPYLPELRDSQLQAYYKIPNYYLITSLDLGWEERDADPAHPLRKKELGERIAKLALAAEYGADSVENASCPIPVKITWEEDKAVIEFKYVSGGLVTEDNEVLKGFVLKKGDKTTEAVSYISGENTVTVQIDQDTEYIGYGMYHLAYSDVTNLKGGNNIPVPTFLFPRGALSAPQESKANPMKIYMALSLLVLLAGSLGIGLYIKKESKTKIKKRRNT